MSAEVPHNDLATPTGLLDQLHTEAGLVAVLLSVACMFLVWLWKQERQGYADERKAHMETIEKLYALSTTTSSQLSVLQATLDKIYQVFLAHKEQ